MRIGAIAFKCLLGVALLATAGSCDPAGDDPLVGRWLRTRTLQVGNQTQVKYWHLQIEADGTFTGHYEKSDDTNNLEQNPFEVLSFREGAWSRDGKNLLFEGDWLHLGRWGIDSLAELEDNLYAFRRSAMMFFERGNELLFLGPDITHFFSDGNTTEQTTDSYRIMHFDTGANRLRRRSSVELRDAYGDVLQAIDEQLTLDVTTGGCTGELTLVERDGSETTEVAGPLTSCGYSVSEVEIDDVVEGAALTVQQVVFTYEAEGLGNLKSEYYVRLGEHYLGHPSGAEKNALRNSAYVRVGD